MPRLSFSNQSFPHLNDTAAEFTGTVVRNIKNCSSQGVLTFTCDEMIVTGLNVAGVPWVLQVLSGPDCAFLSFNNPNGRGGWDPASESPSLLLADVAPQMLCVAGSDQTIDIHGTDLYRINNEWPVVLLDKGLPSEQELAFAADADSVAGCTQIDSFNSFGSWNPALCCGWSSHSDRKLLLPRP